MQGSRDVVGQVRLLRAFICSAANATNARTQASDWWWQDMYTGANTLKNGRWQIYRLPRRLLPAHSREAPVSSSCLPFLRHFFSPARSISAARGRGTVQGYAFLIVLKATAACRQPGSFSSCPPPEESELLLLAFGCFLELCSWIKATGSRNLTQAFTRRSLKVPAWRVSSLGSLGCCFGRTGL